MEQFEERIEDLLIRRGTSTHRRARKFLIAHEVYAGERRLLQCGDKVNPFREKITVDGKDSFVPDLYIMMNKQSHRVCSKKDPGFTTVFDDLSEEIKKHPLYENLHTIGRLDMDTTGLLVFTTNGDFSHSLLIPQTHVPKTYEILLEKNMTAQEQTDSIKKCSAGLNLPRFNNEKGFVTKPALLEFTSENRCRLTITEGKFHQVKRMMEYLGNKVVHLHRTNIGGLTLDSNLAPGQYRNLNEDEVSKMQLNAILTANGTDCRN